MKHILSIQVRNKAGVMSHVSGLFTRRGYNIDSIAVGVTDNPDISNMTIVLRGDEHVLNQFQGQLLKLPDVLTVRHLPFHSALVRELMLLRVEAGTGERADVFAVVEVFGGKICEITEETMLIEVNGDNRSIQGILRMLSRFRILEVARTGQVALGYLNETD